MAVSTVLKKSFSINLLQKQQQENSNMANKIKKVRVKLSSENYEKVMAHYGYRKASKRHLYEAPATYSNGTPFGVLRFWR